MQRYNTNNLPYLSFGIRSPHRLAHPSPHADNVMRTEHYRRALRRTNAEKCVLNFASQWYNYYYYPTCAANYYKNAMLLLCHLFFYGRA